MASRKRIEGKGPADEPRAKRSKNEETHESPEVAIVAVRPERNENTEAPRDVANTAAIEPVRRGGGRGLKGVQSSKEMSTSSTGADGSTCDAKIKVKEQKVFSAKDNTHVQTKMVKELSTKKTLKNGTVIVSSSTSMKKVCYF
eukprot:TRINITY_DN13677_c0_g1_i1.p1 TRINITY_DN13677_c0_g1~~TRINITY_DN13677_c0_g1_i1.p1  ORF type:complete len:143 (+),score=41.38 TRINITY_DN13677_c0_g1_i1:142-570(+)